MQTASFRWQFSNDSFTRCWHTDSICSSPVVSTTAIVKSRYCKRDILDTPKARLCMLSMLIGVCIWRIKDLWIHSYYYKRSDLGWMLNFSNTSHCDTFIKMVKCNSFCSIDTEYESSHFHNKRIWSKPLFSHRPNITHFL